jgi:hypothetical protein
MDYWLFTPYKPRAGMSIEVASPVDNEEVAIEW